MSSVRFRDTDHYIYSDPLYGVSEKNGLLLKNRSFVVAVDIS